MERRFYIQCGSLVGLDPEKALAEFFLDKSLFPSDGLVMMFCKLHELLETHPDFFLIKVRRTRVQHERKIPVVDGEIEVVEVKSCKSFIMPHQLRSYRNIVESGYTIRFLRVNIVSFKRNEFEIREKIITNPTELESFPLKKELVRNREEL